MIQNLGPLRKPIVPCKSKSAGIYALVNMVNGKIYVGSSTDLEFRFAGHERDLKRGDNNPYLVEDWRKYGRDAFYFDVLEYVTDITKLRDREQFWLDEIRRQQEVYNIVLNVGNPFQDPNFIEHMKKATRGKPKTVEHAAKVAAALRGSKRTLEQRKTLSDAHKGNIPWNKGKTTSPRWLLPKERYLELGVSTVRKHRQITCRLFDQECLLGQQFTGSDVVSQRWGGWAVFVEEVKSLLSEEEQPDPQKRWLMRSWVIKLSWARRKGTLIEGETFLAV